RSQLQEHEGWSDAGQKKNPSQHAPKITADAGDGHSANNRCGNGLKFEACAALGIHVSKADRIEQRAKASQCAAQQKDAKGDDTWPDARQPRVASASEPTA